MIWEANFEKREKEKKNGKLHDQGMTHAVTELFLGLYCMWPHLVETTCRSHPYHAI